MEALNYYKTCNVNKNINVNPVLFFETIPENAIVYRGVTMYQTFYIYQGVIISEVVKPNKQWIDTFLDGDKNNYFNVKRPLEALNNGLNMLSKGA